MSRKQGRLAARFKQLAAEGRAGLVTFITAGDPNREISSAIIEGLPGAGADIIELGMPFTDPMADGPAIQASSIRALDAGQNMNVTLAMVKSFREKDDDTPIVLMGYYNPIYIYGVERFSEDAANAGVDGLIIVDIPPEEDAELRIPANKAGIDLVRLTTPTSDEQRLPSPDGRSQWLYLLRLYRGDYRDEISGHQQCRGRRSREFVKFSDLPIAVGFGIKTPEQAAEIARVADAAVVGIGNRPGYR